MARLNSNWIQGIPSDSRLGNYVAIVSGEPTAGGGFIREDSNLNLGIIFQGLKHPGVAMLDGIGGEERGFERIGEPSLAAETGERLDGFVVHLELRRGAEVRQTIGNVAGFLFQPVRFRQQRLQINTGQAAGENREQAFRAQCELMRHELIWLAIG